MRSLGRWAFTWLIVGFLACLGGCASVRLYSETRDKQGQAAVKAWSEVDLKGYFDAERENRAKLLEQDLLTAARLNDVNRETEIRVLAAIPIAKLADHYDQALSELVLEGKPPIPDDERKHFESELRKARNSLATVKSTSKLLERNLSFLEELGVPRFGCERLTHPERPEVKSWQTAHPKEAMAARVRLNEVTRQCESMGTQTKAYRAAIESFRGGELRALAKGLVDAERRLADKENAVAKAKRAYDDALAAYETEVAQLKAGKSTVEKTKELAEKAAAALSVVDSIGTFFSDKLVSEERIKRINALLDSLKAGTELNAEGASKAEIAASLLPALADDIRAVARADKGKGAVPLLIKRDIEQARLNAANFVLAIERRQIALRESALEATISQAATYVNARQRLQDANVATATGNKAVFEAWKELDPKQKGLVLESTTLYLDAFSRQRNLGDTLRIQRMALVQEESIGLAEVNASMWTALIGATVSQAAEFSSLGLKAADFEKILNTLGILWIGYGVNK